MADLILWPFPLPDRFLDALGYPRVVEAFDSPAMRDRLADLLRRHGIDAGVALPTGPRRFVMFHWQPAGDELAFTDLWAGYAGGGMAPMTWEADLSVLVVLDVLLLTGFVAWSAGPAGWGLSSRAKWSLLGLISGLAAFVLWNRPFGLGIDFVLMPGLPQPGRIDGFILLLGALAITGSARAAKLCQWRWVSSAAHTAAVAYLAYGIIAQLSGRTYLVSFCLTVAGALLAFAWFDWSFKTRSTELFLENGGALALGATLAVLVLVLGEVLLLPLIGFVFLAVMFSDILGSGSARFRRGGRRSPVDPLHHYFETMGMSERQVAQRFWLVSMVAGLLGVALALV